MNPPCVQLHPSIEYTRVQLYDMHGSGKGKASLHRIVEEKTSSLHQRCLHYIRSTSHVLKKKCSFRFFISPGAEERQTRAAPEAEGTTERRTTHNRKQKGAISAVVQPPKRQKQGQFIRYSSPRTT